MLTPTENCELRLGACIFVWIVESKPRQMAYLTEAESLGEQGVLLHKRRGIPWDGSWDLDDLLACDPDILVLTWFEARFPYGAVRVPEGYLLRGARLYGTLVVQNGRGWF